MSYLVLARKWRPQVFDDVIGQPHVTKTLQNAISSGRVAHAYLFTGARGVGKTSVARILAKALNCAQGPTVKPCNECSSCREITQGNFVDVLEIDGASNRGIDNIRELRETVRYRPAKGRYKTYIIDEVHMLTTEAFNALLKTLEEPPEHVVFIFATTEPHKIPATILSRCQRFDFRRIPTSLLVEHLKSVATQENAMLSDTVLYAVAREADGSMRDGQSLIEQILAFSGAGLSDEDLLDILGVVDRRSVLAIGRAIIAGDVRTCIECVEDLYRRGIDSKRFCQHLCEHFRNLLFLSLEGEGGVKGLLDLPQEERSALKEEAKATTPETLYLYFQIIVKGEEEIRRSSLPKMALEMLLLKLTQLPRLQSLDRLLERVSHLESRVGREISPGVCDVEEAKAAAREKAHGLREEGDSHASAPISYEVNDPVEPLQPGYQDYPGAGSEAKDVEGRWPAFLRWLQDRDPILAAKLGASRVRAISEDAHELEVIELYEDHFTKQESVTALQDVTRAYFGRAFQWSVKSRPSLKAETKGAPKPRGGESRASVRLLVMENPLVQAAIEMLGGELVDIRHLKSDRSDT